MIRPAKNTPEERSAIDRLLDYGVTHGRLLPRTPQDIERLIGEEHLYVADLDGAIAGMAALEVYSERLTEVRSLVVLPEWHGMGIGSALVERCVEEARRLGVREVLAITDRIDLFTRVGFRTQLDDQVPLFIKLIS